MIAEAASHLASDGNGRGENMGVCYRNSSGMDDQGVWRGYAVRRAIGSIAINRKWEPFLLSTESTALQVYFQLSKRVDDLVQSK